MLKEIWGELYWNTSDWIPWLMVQIAFSAVVGGVIQWWLRKGGFVVFFAVLMLVFAANVSRLPPKAISEADIAKLNEKLPQEFGDISIESVSFPHRFLIFHAVSSEPLDGFQFDEDMTIEQCRLYGSWLASRRIKQVQYIVSWPGGGTVLAMTDADCRSSL